MGNYNPIVLARGAGEDARTKARRCTDGNDCLTAYRTPSEHIGARVVSFHHSGVEASVEFGRQALPFAHEHDLLLAYENGAQSMPVIAEILGRLDDERFGLLLDVGHAANGRTDASDIIESCRRAKEQLVRLHGP